MKDANARMVETEQLDKRVKERGTGGKMEVEMQVERLMVMNGDDDDDDSKGRVLRDSSCGWAEAEQAAEGGRVGGAVVDQVGV